MKLPGDVSPVLGPSIVGALRATRCRCSVTYAPDASSDREDAVVRNISVHEIPDVGATARALEAIQVTMRLDTGRVFFDA